MQSAALSSEHVAVLFDGMHDEPDGAIGACRVSPLSNPVRKALSDRSSRVRTYLKSVLIHRQAADASSRMNQTLCELRRYVKLALAVANVEVDGVEMSALSNICREFVLMSSGTPGQICDDK